MAIMVGIAVLFAAVLYSAVAGGRLSGGGPSLAAVTPSPSPHVAAPTVTFLHQTCCTQAARFLDAAWGSNERISAASFSLDPAPPFACSATVDATGLAGRFGCVGLLAGATDFVGHLLLTTDAGTFTYEHAFRTMGDSLQGVKWFTEFEDPTGDPVECAAASVRMIQLYTTGEDKLTATEILQAGRAFNKSADPGIDPAAIATEIHQLDPRNTYHYYRFATRADATGAAVYWLLRSGKPVIAITLAGQHAPVVTGFQGTYGTYYDDPNNKITGVVVEDPQRGDLNPATAGRRPDKPRAADYQTGHLVPLQEWNTDDWWLGYAYQGTIKMPNGSYLNIDRNDRAYPTPHWAGKFVILVDDGDAANPPDREGRVTFR
ncbi:MAG: hypothetical protein KGJ98_01700 [Chloroflexota bacterium]|nr:hypothetical protein [Chloroflexota bacterium]MDE3100928.1 hypothetical protein [Chloroflexota bacterium]